MHSHEADKKNKGVGWYDWSQEAELSPGWKGWLGTGDRLSWGPA